MRACQERIGDEKAAVRRALRSFVELGSALIGARFAQTPLDAAVSEGLGWEGLGGLVDTASVLAETIASDPLEYVLAGYGRFRRYTPRMLRTLDIEPSPAAEPLLEAVDALREGSKAQPTGFLRPNSKWARLLRAQLDRRFWETAVLFHLRDAFRSGDVWLVRSRRYGDIRRALLPTRAVADAGHTAVPADPDEWLTNRRAALDEGLRRLGAEARDDRQAPRVIANKPTSSPSGSTSRGSTTTLRGDPQHRSPREISFHRLSFTPVPVATALNRPPNRGRPTPFDQH